MYLCGPEAAGAASDATCRKIGEHKYSSLGILLRIVLRLCTYAMIRDAQVLTSYLIVVSFTTQPQIPQPGSRENDRYAASESQRLFQTKARNLCSGVLVAVPKKTCFSV
jgi:hypothetical protein